MVKRIYEELNCNYREDKWVKEIRSIAKETGLEKQDMKTITKGKIKDTFKKWDLENWKKEISEKSSLHVYKKHKLDISEENCYDNHPSSTTFFRCRANIVTLEDRNRFKNNGDITCKECGAVKEDLEHFLLYCPLYQEIRKNNRLFDQPYNENWVGHLLFENKGKREDIKKIIHQFWKRREKERAQP